MKIKLSHIILLLSLTMSMGAIAQSFVVKRAKVNTMYDEYSPIFYQDGLVFCSNRKGQNLASRTDTSGAFISNLFFSKLGEDKTAGLTKQFSNWLPAAANEGSACFSEDFSTVWFTGNVLGKKKNQVLGLGLYSLDLTIPGAKPVAFAHNSEKGKYNLAHPALSPDGKILIFTSDQKGEGGADLCYSVKNGPVWSKPKNMGEQINTSGNEVFPTFDSLGKLYFSSDGRENCKGLDIFVCVKKGEGWSTPGKMNKPINSDQDDYGYIIHPSGEFGYLSSARDRTKGDELYRFDYVYPKFSSCDESQEPTLCYLIQETKINFNDSMPLIFEWDLGDGTKKNGLAVEHCFPDSGYYHLELNIYDTLINTEYLGVSKLDLHIEYPNNPLITCEKDTIVAGETLSFSSAQSFIGDFDVEDFYWNVGKNEEFRQADLDFTFKKPGVYKVKLGALSVPNEKGKRQKRCVQKDILVLRSRQLENLQEEQRQAEMMAKLDAEEAERKRLAAIEEQNKMAQLAQKAEAEEAEALSGTYVIAKNKELTDFEPQDMDSLYKVYKKMVKDGRALSELLTAQIANKKAKVDFVPITEAERIALNTQLNKLLPVQFDTITGDILEKHYENLNYLCAMLRYEPRFSIEIEVLQSDVQTKRLDHEIAAIGDYVRAKGVRNEQVKVSSVQQVTAESSAFWGGQNHQVIFEIITSSDPIKTAQK